MMKKVKVGFVPKMILSIGMAIIIGLGILYFIEAYHGTISFFTKHFLLPIVLFVVGAIAIFLPNVSRRSYSGDDKGDKLMLGVGVLLIFCSFLTLGLSFL